MHIEVTYQWRIRWCGKWTTTRHHCTEEQIRKEHTEATRIDSSRRQMEIADTPAEAAAGFTVDSAGKFAGGPPGREPPK